MTLTLSDASLLRRDGWIDGKPVSSERRFSVIDPATQLEITNVSDLDGQHATTAVAAALLAFKTWRRVSVEKRIALVLGWAALIEENAHDLAKIIIAESGKPVAQAQGEAMQCAALLRWFAQRGNDIDAAADARVIKQPIGVVACITPWNFPAAAVAVKAGAAIVAGCSAIVKPSEQTPLIALAMAELAGRAGIPAGVLNVVPCREPAAVGDVLCASNDVRMLTFTGSTPVGKQLYAACGNSVKRLALELGGNAPFIVFDDASLEDALDGAMGARFYNSGQICVGANRFLIQSGIYDEFAERLADRVQDLRVGPGAAPDTDVGPMINRAAIHRLTKIVESALSMGAKPLAGGELDDRQSLFFPATVLAAMTPQMPAYEMEIFGPVACLYSFTSEDDALRLANDTQAGLSAYIFTSDAARLERFVDELEAGVVGANTTNIFSNDLPFGGIKHSGLGREHGVDCLDEFLEIKSVCRGSVL